ncbi:MAG: UvrD-helicase domain-containing protein, partial [Bacilli bacterium]|nr:UvrD-helicase domain-containing protein [Bacilli bacterium]
MGLFQKLFKKKEVNNDNPYIDFLKVYNELLSQDKYLARSDYKDLVEDYKESFLELDKIYKYSFDKYCAENNFDKNEVKKFYDLYSDLKNLKEGSKEIKKHNNLFLDKHLKSDKEFLDNVLSNIDKNITLDEEQRKVVLSDEDYTLVIAGAGAGKTTTLAAKVSYLVNVKNVDPKKILVISFTNKAVNELKERINDVLH